jgi:hypothetical protein
MAVLSFRDHTIPFVASAKGAETTPLVRPRRTSNRLRRLCCWSTSLFQLSQSGSHPKMDSIRRPGTQTHQLSIGLLTVVSSCLCYTELQHKDGLRRAYSCEALPHLIDRSHLPVHGCALSLRLHSCRKPGRNQAWKLRDFAGIFPPIASQTCARRGILCRKSQPGFPAVGDFRQDVRSRRTPDEHRGILVIVFHTYSVRAAIKSATLANEPRRMRVSVILDSSPFHLPSGMLGVTARPSYE